MIADEVTAVRSILDLKYPIREGIIQDKEELELLWEYTLTKKLNVKNDDLKSRSCIITEAPMNPFHNKEIMTEILLEKIGIGGLNIEAQAKLAIMNEGKSSGLVLDSGDGVTHCIPVVHNTIDHHNITRLNIAGRHITEYLIRLLQMKGYNFNSSADFEIVRELKEKFCFVSPDIEQDRRIERETCYYNSYFKLDNGKTIKISNEKFEAPEILFNPMLIQNECVGIHDMVVNCIQNSAMDNRKLLYECIILSGANTMFKGFSSRIESEILKSYKKNVLKDSRKINIPIIIVDNPKRNIAVFMGAAFLANTLNQNHITDYWILKKEWEECGSQILYKKCTNIMI